MNIPEVTIAEYRKLWELCQKFIVDNTVSCPEATCGDSVYEKAPELTEEIANIVGYFEWPDSE